MEIKTQVTTYMVEKKCDKCEDGFMKCTGSGITTWNTSWDHLCDKCENYCSYDKKYPFMEYKKIVK